MVCLLVTSLLLLTGSPALSADSLSDFDRRALRDAEECRAQIVDQFELLLTSGQLSMAQLFDTFYIPIPNTNPQKFHTQYDQKVDGILRPILDGCLARSKRYIFVVAVDRNGYLPTHNTKYSQPLTGNPDVDLKRNRTKRIFNDRTGLAAARNTKPYLIQHYTRDTGEIMTDLSVPIVVRGRHWGALRFGYRK
ncbi:MAG: chemotaxis protein [Deltaproteobacteria bacterium]|nr:MAG: chemotaxis protein [Deltaproteobacteria bacterium]